MLPALLLAGLVALLAASMLFRQRRPAEPSASVPPPAPAPDPSLQQTVTRKVLAAAVAPGPTISGPIAPTRREDPLDALDLLLAELESATVRIDGADELDERAVKELEGLAARFEAAAESFAAR